MFDDLNIEEAIDFVLGDISEEELNELLKHIEFEETDLFYSDEEDL